MSENIDTRLSRRYSSAVYRTRTLGIVLALSALSSCAPDVPEPDRLDRIRTLVESGSYREAEAAGRSLLQTLEAEEGRDSPAVAAILDALVRTRVRRRKIDEETIDFAQRAIGIKEAAPVADPLDIAVSRSLLGSCYLVSNRLSEAEEEYRKVYEARRAHLPDSASETAVALVNLALVEAGRGDLIGSRKTLHRALALDAEYGIASERVAAIHDRLSRNSLTLGDHENAIFHANKAIDGYGGPEGAETGRILDARWTIGRALAGLGRTQEAIEVLDDVVKQRTADAGATSLLTTRVMNSLALAHLKAGDVQRAAGLYRRVLDVYESGDSSSSRLALAYRNYGSVLAAAGNYGEARTAYEQTLKLRREHYSDTHHKTGAAWKHIAEIDLLSGDLDAAYEKAVRSETIMRESLLALAAGYGNREAQRIADHGVHGFSVAMTALLRMPAAERPLERFLDEVVLRRAAFLDQVAEQQRLLRSRAPEELLDALKRARLALAELIREGPGESAAAYHEQLRRAEEARVLAQRTVAEAAGIESERSPVTGRSVRGAIPEGRVLVSYLRFERVEPRFDGLDTARTTTYAALVATDRSLDLVDLGPADVIDTAVEAWRLQAERRPSPVRTLATRAENDYRATAVELRRLVLDPLTDAIANRHAVIVVPDGALHTVNFATLVDDQGRYLAERGPAFHVLSAERDLVRPRGRTNEGLFVLGGAAFGRIPETAPTEPESCRGLENHWFVPLDPSRIEAETLSRTWVEATSGPDRDVDTYLSGDATEAAVRREAGTRRVVHLATHGFFASDLCGGWQELDPLEDVEARLAGRILSDPLIFSGLALAGANVSRDGSSPSDDDGILTAEEIAGLDWSGVEWVVLSACKTGLGEVLVGEGVLGLRRAFETAGVATLIMSLWNVDDEATRSFMIALYRERLSGASTVESMRAAYREVLVDRRAAHRSTHPFYWGAFVATGDAR